MSAGSTIIGRNTPSRIGERDSTESARLSFPARKASQSHASQSRSAGEMKRAPAFKRRNLRLCVTARSAKTAAPISHKANDKLKIIGRLIEGLTLTAGDEV